MLIQQLTWNPIRKLLHGIDSLSKVSWTIITIWWSEKFPIIVNIKQKRYNNKKEINLYLFVRNVDFFFCLLIIILVFFELFFLGGWLSLCIFIGYSWWHGGMLSSLKAMWWRNVSLFHVEKRPSCFCRNRSELHTYGDWLATVLILPEKSQAKNWKRLRGSHHESNIK